MIASFFASPSKKALALPRRGAWAVLAACVFTFAARGADPTPDTSFGDGGQRSYGAPSGYASLRLGPVLADGRFYVHGENYSGFAVGEGFIERRLADGSVDTTFGTAGRIVAAGNAAVQPDGKLVLLTVSNGTNRYVARLLRHHPDGRPDTSFGSGGAVVISDGLPLEATRFDAIATLADGRVVVAGSTFNSGVRGNVQLRRFTAAGAPDNTFDGDGIATVSLARHGRFILPVADDKFILVCAGVDSVSDVSALRITSGGSVDNTFASGRYVYAPGGTLYLQDATLGPGGSVCLAGFTFGNGISGWVVKLASTGQPAAGFGASGVSVIGAPATWATQVLRVLPRGDGSLLLAATQQSGAQRRAGLLRLDSAGALDAAFAGGGGLAAWNPASSGFVRAELSGLAPRGSDGFLVFGAARPSESLSGYLELALTSTGAIDTARTGGPVRVSYADAYTVERLRGLRRLADGGYLLVGSTGGEAGIDGGSLGGVLKIGADGLPDNTFGTAGLYTTAARFDAMDAEPLPAGGFLFVGQNTASSNNHFGHGKLTATGALDGSIGSFVTAAGTQQKIRRLAPIPGGGFYAAGLGLIKFTSAGALDQSYGGGRGFVLLDGAVSDLAQDIAVASDASLWVLTSAAITRYDARGALLPDWGDAGRASLPALFGTQRMVRLPDGAFVVCGRDGGVLRVSADGKNLTAFRSLPAGSVTTLADVVVQPRGSVVAAGITPDGRLLLARWRADGEFDTSFGSGGLYRFAVMNGTRILSVSTLAPSLRLLLEPDGAGLVVAGSDVTSLSSFYFNFWISRWRLPTEPVPPTPEINIDATDAEAAQLGLDPGSFTLSRGGDLSAPLVVRLAATGSAEAGVHYTALPASVTIPAGSASATLAVAPLRAPVLPGDRRVELSLVSDPAAYRNGAKTTATVTIRALPRVTWTAAAFGASALDLAIAGPISDPDHDGAVNLIEYAFATDPLAAEVTPSLRLEFVDGNPNLVHRLAKIAADLRVTVESCDDLRLGNWAVQPTTEVSREDHGAHWTIRLRPTPPPSGGRRFFRLHIATE